MSDSSVHNEKPAPLARKIGARSLLQDLRIRVIGTTEFRRGLEQFICDSSAVDQLIRELNRMDPGNRPAQ